MLMLCKMLNDKGLAVKLLSTDEATATESDKWGISVVNSVRIMPDIQPVKDVMAVVKLWRFLRRNRFDIVHTHTSKPGFIGRLAARLASVPVVVHTSHGFAFDTEGREHLNGLFVWLERLAGRWTDSLLVVSQHNYRVALEHDLIAENKMTYVPNFIESGKYASDEKTRLAKRAELGLEPESPVVGMVGRLCRQKSPADFVRACTILSKRWPKVQFVLVGDGPERSEIDQLVENSSLGGQLTMTGFRRDIPELLSIIDVFVLPSLWEGMSISLLEAMAAGKAIVATDIEPNMEVLRHEETALLVPPKDPQKLAMAVERLLSDGDFAESLSRRSRQLIGEQYSPEVLMEKIWLAYEGQIERKLSGLGGSQAS